MITVVVMVGIPGCGKSTIINNLSKIVSSWSSAFVYSTDNEIEEYAQSVGKTYSEVFSDYFKIAESSMNKKLEQAINDGRLIIWDQTNLSSSKRKKLCRRFKKFKKIALHILPPNSKEDWVEHQRRIDSRVGKNIPDFVIKNMLVSYSPPSEDEGFDVVWNYNMYGESLG